MTSFSTLWYSSSQIHSFAGVREPPTMKKPLLLLLVAVTPAVSDIVIDGLDLNLGEIYDLEYARISDHWAMEPNSTQYYCVFRSNWNSEDHPNDYPELAHFGAPVMFSHTKQFAPFIKGKRAEYGVEKIAEVSSGIDHFLPDCQSSSILPSSLTRCFRLATQKVFNRSLSELVLWCWTGLKAPAFSSTRSGMKTTFTCLILSKSRRTIRSFLESLACYLLLIGLQTFISLKRSRKNQVFIGSLSKSGLILGMQVLTMAKNSPPLTETRIPPVSLRDLQSIMLQTKYL